MLSSLCPASTAAAWRTASALTGPWTQVRRGEEGACTHAWMRLDRHVPGVLATSLARLPPPCHLPALTPSPRRPPHRHPGHAPRAPPALRAAPVCGGRLCGRGTCAQAAALRPGARVHEGWGLGVALRSARPPPPNPGCKPRNFTPHACPPHPCSLMGCCQRCWASRLTACTPRPSPTPPPSS